MSVSVEMSDGVKIQASFPQRFVSKSGASQGGSCYCRPCTYYLQHDSLDPYVELLGKVEQDRSLSIQRVVNFGADFGELFGNIASVQHSHA